MRRYFSDTDKRAIVADTEQPGVSVSAVARRHGIVTGLLFRGRVEFGAAAKAKAKARLARVAQANHTPAVAALQALVSPPEGMTAIDLPDGRRVFAPAGADPDIVQRLLDNEETGRC